VRVLLTGGAGYIGGAVALRLAAAGHDVVVVDDLSTGHRDTVRGVDLLPCDIADRERVGGLLRRRRIEAVVHLAASCLVGESMEHPGRYYDNNVVRALALLEEAATAGVARFVFSSSAAVYGEPERLPLDESHPLRPTNPYGETKLAFERALHWSAAAHRFAVTSLRYFNAAGATLDGAHGEAHDPETHLVPNLLRAAALGRPAPVFGTDYPTPDGSAVRDYVHIEDLAEAHRLALERAQAPGTFEAFNLGNGGGFSVLQVIDAARRVTRRPIAVDAKPRRPGDPAILVASSERARTLLGWKPLTASLEGILESAWRFHQRHPFPVG
jgi:UDP-glucose 4-epimerase